MMERFDSFLTSLPVGARYFVDCLSQLCGEAVETIAGYLLESGSVCYHAHCGSCGEHKDTFRHGGRT